MTRRNATHIIFYLILIAAAAVFLLPIYLMVLTGFKPFNEVDLKTMWNLPTTGLQIENFISAFKQLAPNLGNSLEMVIPEAILSALMDNRQTIGRDDIGKGIHMVKNRDAIRHLNWL